MSKIILKGLPNVGQSCYINAVIITLFHIKELREYILNLSVDDKDTFIFYLQCIFKRLEMEDNIRRSDFCTLIQVFRSHCGPFTRIMQEDAYQFLLFVLSRVQQHICAEQNISPGIISNTIITDLFRGLQKDVSICQNCKLTVSNNQLFYSLSLTSNSKTITITELLMENSRDIYVSQNFRCYYCDNTQCTLKSSIHQWPRYLIISLSKLKQGFMRKLFKNAWKLTVPKLQFVAPQSSDSQGQSGSEQTAAKKEGEVDQGKEVRYDLKAVIDHKGTAYHGHYKATVLTADWDWIEFDDAKVNIRNSNDIISRINYILLFKREDSQDVPSILSK